VCRAKSSTSRVMVVKPQIVKVTEDSEEDGEDLEVEADIRAQMAKSKVFNKEEGGNI